MQTRTVILVDGPAAKLPVQASLKAPLRHPVRCLQLGRDPRLDKSGELRLMGCNEVPCLRQYVCQCRRQVGQSR